MKKIHDSFVEKFSWYRFWHQNLNATLFHWVIFTLVVIGFFMFLNGSMLNTFHQSVSFSQQKMPIIVYAKPAVTTEGNNEEMVSEFAPQPNHSILSNAFEQESSKIKDRYIVVLKDTGKDVDDDVAEVEKAHGLKRGHTYKYALRGFSADIAQEKLEAVKKNPKVAYVEKDDIVTVTAQTVPTGVDRIDVDKNLTAKIDGIDERVDVDVAVLDTGVDFDHPDLNVVESVDFTSNGIDDVHGHGTHVAGTIAALDNDIGVVGVAPGARIYSVKVLGDSGSGTWSGTIAGIDWVTQRADIIEIGNLSLGGSGFSTAVRSAFQNSVAKGVVYVVAAGNDARDIYGADGVFGTGDEYIPAAYPEVAAISAVSPNSDVMASFSNFSGFVVNDNPVVSLGAAIDLSAPGVSIYSTYRGGSYATMSGTSMASPHVAGLVALYIAKNGRPTNASGVAQVRQEIINMAEPQTLWASYPNTGDRDTNKEHLGDAEPINQNPNQQPMVSITDPVANQKINGMYRVLVSAEDPDGSIATVEAAVDSGSYINITANASSSAYYYDWNTVLYSEGNHTIKAKAIDNQGSFKNAQNVTVSVDNIDNNPVVTIRKPSSQGTVSQNALVQATATDDRWPVTTLNYSIDGGAFKALAYNSGASSWEANWDTQFETDGQHQITVEAFDNAGQRGEKTIIVFVDNTVPSVEVTYPSQNSVVSGVIPIKIDAQDAVALMGSLQVEYALDAGLWVVASYNSASQKYESVWNSSLVENGFHAIMARATDKGGNSAQSSEAQFNVQNFSPADMYVWNISWSQSSKRGQITLKVPIAVKNDSNANGVAESSDSDAFKAKVYVVLTYAGSDGIFGTGDDMIKNLSATTNKSGLGTVSWSSAPRGKYQAKITGLSHNSYQWNSNLDTITISSYTTK